MPVSSFAWLQWVSKLVLQVVPPVTASVISAYLLSTYHVGSKEAPPVAPAQSARVDTAHATPASLSAAVIDAEHANALHPVQSRHAADANSREAEQIIALPPVAAAMQRIRQGRDVSREAPAVTRVSAAAADSPPAVITSDVANAPDKAAPPVAEAEKPQEARVLGMRIPQAVASAGQTIVHVGVEQPAKLVGAGIDFSRKTIDALASLIPESRR